MHESKEISFIHNSCAETHLNIELEPQVDIIRVAEYQAYIFTRAETNIIILVFGYSVNFVSRYLPDN